MLVVFFFFLKVRRPPRSTLGRSSAASDVYKRQHDSRDKGVDGEDGGQCRERRRERTAAVADGGPAVSFTHIPAPETGLDLHIRLLL